MTLLPIFVNLTPNQKNKLIRGYKKREPVNLKLHFSNEKDGNRIFVTKTQYNKITKGIKPVVIAFNETHYKSIDKDTKKGGTLLSSLIGPLTKVVSKVAPILTKSVLPGLATGISSSLASLGIDSLFSGKGIDGKTGDLIKALAVIENELRKMPKDQKSKFDQVMMTGNGTQSGGFLGTLLASIGIPMIMKLLGSGLHNAPSGGYKIYRKKIPIPTENQPVVKQTEGSSLNWRPYSPPPFYDDHEIIESKGRGLKKKDQKHTGREFCSEKTAYSKTCPY